ncbi:MAG: UDP-N-acetyl-D-mannosamine dehydrogenase [Myxococcales bacterium FL481]|nr:MAG: UDP-N-acetyl-D-mannosamine dehydrogenase [Myxococcales bacterium FL481]
MKGIRSYDVCVVGLGYIGLPTAAVLASRGHRVHGVEVREQARETINTGRAHIIEPDLDMLVRSGIESQRLRAHAEPKPSDVFILCVPTPIDGERRADLEYVRQAAISICPHLKHGDLVILESTSPPGTTEMIARLVTEHTSLRPGDVHFAHAPERVLPGNILHEVVHNDRIIGGIDDESTLAARTFFETFVRGELIECHCRTAELAKLVENASRDVQIAFANELSMLCDRFDVDPLQLIEIANRHPRVNILQPGCGVGGHCIAVDPYFIIDAVGEGNAPLIETARRVNRHKPHWVVEKVKAAASKLRQPVIACFGATYKPDIDDLRESPAREIINELRAAEIGRILVVEPNVDSLDDHPLVSIDQARREADIFVFLVGHRAFRKIAPAQLAEKMVIDTCGATTAHHGLRREAAPSSDRLAVA